MKYKIRALNIISPEGADYIEFELHTITRIFFSLIQE
jgi:hypothetical protein